MAVAGVNYSGPKLLANIVSKLMADQKNARILDLGAGTGLVGKHVSYKQAIHNRLPQNGVVGSSIWTSHFGQQVENPGAVCYVFGPTKQWSRIFITAREAVDHVSALTSDIVLIWYVLPVLALVSLSDVFNIAQCLQLIISAW